MLLHGVFYFLQFNVTFLEVMVLTIETNSR